jgi:CRP/FNR family transcriptional regulator
LRLFCNLSSSELDDFSAIGTHLLVPPGSTLFREHEPTASVDVICSGKVKLSCGSRDGRTLILKIALPGDLLGLSAAISGSSHETTAEALEPVTIKRIPRADFLSFIQRHGQASLHAAQSLSKEYKAVFYDARRLALSTTAAGRLASVLLDWATSACPANPATRFTIALTHEDLANLAGTSRETVTRTLAQFRRDELIQIHGSSMTILDLEKLSLIAS